jgi:hypothetical protein
MSVAHIGKILRPYRPSNGTEGEFFIESHCCKCIKDRNEDCPILAASFAYNVDEPGYPKEWVEVDDGPMCTAYVPDVGQDPNEPTQRELEQAGQERLF